MANVFEMSDERNREVKRNVFDLSFQNNLTMKFGYLYPCLLKEVLPGNTYSIKPTFAFEFLPMVFPVQTRMRAYVHYFYVRRRNLWDRYPDFAANNGDYEVPYLDFNANFEEYTQTGRLGDYMGLPTTVVGTYADGIVTTPTMQSSNINDITTSGTKPSPYLTKDILFEQVGRFYPFGSSGIRSIYTHSVSPANPTSFDGLHVSTSTLYYSDSYNLTAGQLANEGFRIDSVIASTISSVNVSGIDSTFGVTVQFAASDSQGNATVQTVFDNYEKPVGVTVDSYYDDDSKKSYRSTYSFSYDSDICRELGTLDPETKIVARITFLIGNVAPGSGSGISSYSNPEKHYWCDPSTKAFKLEHNVNFVPSLVTEVKPLTRENSPFYDSTSDKSKFQLKINAEPFRAYEQIYNAFYRDIRNNPLIIDGVPEYNKFCENTGSGVDTTRYRLHRRNWEKDFLTTAVQSPQQGIAPLVGMTTMTNSIDTDVKFTAIDGKEYTARITTKDDGQIIQDVLVGESNIPDANMRSIIDYATSGISINDFRNVNAFQLWLEINARKGPRFRDFIEGQYDVTIRYDELNMPEFIGGSAEDVRVNMVTQTSSDVPDSPLGSYAGQATCVGTSNNYIQRYCDEPGYLIGIVCVVPVPNYSQLLPKLFIKRNPLDVFTPVFGHIGFQPIRYSEVCPVQAFNEDPELLNKEFGYQRSWYDYLASVDEVHGLFRTSLRNYLINRVFDRRPELSESFLLVDPKQVNDVFASTTDNDDKILGQIYHEIRVKQPVPMYGTPRLEA